MTKKYTAKDDEERRLGESLDFAHEAKYRIEFVNALRGKVVRSRHAMFLGEGTQRSFRDKSGGRDFLNFKLPLTPLTNTIQLLTILHTLLTLLTKQYDYLRFLQ